MLIIPAIDIKDEKAVRLIQGDYSRETIYSEDPVKVAKEWESQGAQMLHIVDLDGAKDGRITNIKTINEIVKSVKIPVEVCGGIRNEESVKQLLDSGVSRVVVGTVALENENLLKALLEKFAGKIVVGLDAKNGQLMSKGWVENTGKDLVETARYLSLLGVEGFIYTDILKDGSLTSPNFEMIQTLLENLRIPIFASGGISSLEDIKRLKSLGVEGVILGKALYEKRINLEEALNVG